jgi:hypothetical protein
MKNKNACKLLLLLLFSQSFILYAQNLIEITINGEPYVREYPETLQEAYTLIDSLVKINNNLDNSFLEYQKINNQEKDSILTKLNMLEHNNTVLRTEIEELNTKNKEITSLFENYSKRTQNKLLFYTSVGPSYHLFNNNLGMEITFGGIRRISVFNLFDLYVGLNINTSIYYQEVRNKVSNLGVGAILGIFLK